MAAPSRRLPIDNRPKGPLSRATLIWQKRKAGPLLTALICCSFMCVLRNAEMLLLWLTQHSLKCMQRGFEITVFFHEVTLHGPISSLHPNEEMSLPSSPPESHLMQNHSPPSIETSNGSRSLIDQRAHGCRAVEQHRAGGGRGLTIPLFLIRPLSVRTPPWHLLPQRSLLS